MALLGLILGLTLSQTECYAEQPFSIAPIKNTGVLFEEIGNLMAYHSTWVILTEVNLSELDNQTVLAERAEHYVYTLCGNNTVENLCNLQQKHVHVLLENIKRRTNTIRQAIPKSRYTRSIFDGIGNAMHYLFGTMDNTNEREVYSRLEELESDQQALKELEKQQVSVVKTALEQIQKPLNSIAERQQQIGYQLNDISNLTDKLVIGQKQQEVISTLLLQLIEIEFRQQAILDIITTSRNNQIHPLLIAPKTLLDIREKSQPACANRQNCLSILYQTAEVRTHLLQDKLIVKINLPIFNLPQMRLQQIKCFPIHTKSSYSLVPDIEYSHVASQIATQDFLLLKPENIKEFRKITREMDENLYVGRLNTPVTKAALSTECIIKLLFNPLEENPNCSLKVQLPPRDTLVKLNRPNSWLYAFKSITVIHVTCTQKLLTHRLTGQGILTLKEPCHLQIGPHTLHYEAEGRHPLKIAQPEYFPNTNKTALEIENIISISAHPMEPRSEEPTLLINSRANEKIYESTKTLDQLRTKLEELQTHSRSKTHHVLSTTSVSVTGVALLALVIYTVIKRIRPGKTTVDQSDESQEAEAKPGAKTQEPRRSQTLPRSKSIQLV